MANFVQRIAGNVLRTIAIELLKGQLIRILSAGGEASEFGVLNPQIALNDFGGCKKLKDGNISVGNF